MTSRHDLINDVRDGKVIRRAIKQGLVYQVIFKYPGNIATGVPVGQIRDKPVDDEDSVVLGAFDFPMVTYDTTEGKTTIVAEIPSEFTKLIPITKYAFIDNGSATAPTISATEKNCWIYDIRTQDSTGKDIGIVDYGLVQVVARYTGG